MDATTVLVEELHATTMVELDVHALAAPKLAGSGVVIMYMGYGDDIKSRSFGPML
jgi:hypothetical protein